MIIRIPEKYRHLKPAVGQKVDTLVDLADLFPTILNMAGLPAPADIIGIDLMSLVGNSMDREFYGECGETFFCIIRDDYKYTWAKAGGEELLFNLKQDPMEKHNLAVDTEAIDVLRAMRSALIQRMSTHNNVHVDEGNLKPGPPITGPQDVKKWPGFHSTSVDSDVLH
jgi:arylsulfatase A-like enzyme